MRRWSQSRSGYCMNLRAYDAPQHAVVLPMAARRQARYASAPKRLIAAQ